MPVPPRTHRGEPPPVRPDWIDDWQGRRTRVHPMFMGTQAGCGKVQPVADGGLAGHRPDPRWSIAWRDGGWHVNRREAFAATTQSGATQLSPSSGARSKQPLRRPTDNSRASDDFQLLDVLERGDVFDLLNDALIFLCAGEHGAVLVSGNVADIDVLLRFRPDIQVLLYRVRPSGDDSPRPPAGAALCRAAA
jgi:hypothetical protein